MNRKNPIIVGAFILTMAGFATKIIGFFFRIFLSRAIGAEGMGIYQLIFPVFSLCHSICCSGIEISISRYVAAKNSKKSQDEPLKILFCGLSFSVLFSLVTALLVYCNSFSIAKYVLQDIRCDKLLKCLAFALPLSSIHSCISGYYFGRKKALIPALSQLLEQIVRTVTVYICLVLFTSMNLAATPLIAVYGTVSGELASSAFTLFSIGKTALQSTGKKTGSVFSYGKNILRMSFPITLNRVIGTALLNLEAILIPFCLRKGGYSSTDALSIYGTLTGMAIPLVMFPSSIITSISTMLLPTISEAQGQKNNCSICSATQKILRFCLVTGIFCTFAFITYGNAAGTLIFHNSDVGSYIVTLAWLCPFLYISITFGSILNGLGKTKTTFYHNIIISVLKIVFIWILVPSAGIKGYLWGLLFAQILVCLLHYQAICKWYPISFHAFHYIVLPALCSGLSIILAMPFHKIAGIFFGYISFPALAVAGGIAALSYALMITLLDKSA